MRNFLESLLAYSCQSSPFFRDVKSVGIPPKTKGKNHKEIWATSARHTETSAHKYEISLSFLNLYTGEMCL